MLTATIRRAEFNEERLERALEILDAARYGHLATVGSDGDPQVRPINFARGVDTIYVHCASDGALGAQVGREAVLSVVDGATWLPSYWRHPEMECSASTYYRSVQVRGRIRAVEQMTEKALAVQAFMERYQPEGGHTAAGTGSSRYAGLTVLALPLDRWTCKVKMGQHLAPDVRISMHERLVERRDPADVACAIEMRRANADIPSEYPCDVGGLRWSDDPAEMPVDSVYRLLSATYWAAKRPRWRVARNLRDSTLSLAASDGDGVVAYARMAMLRRDIAWVFDVVVAPTRRGNGLGSELVGRLLAHPATRGIRRLFLDTRDAMTLYERHGFTRIHRSEASGSVLMVREES